MPKSTGIVTITISGDALAILVAQLWDRVTYWRELSQRYEEWGDKMASLDALHMAHVCEELAKTIFESGLKGGEDE